MFEVSRCIVTYPLAIKTSLVEATYICTNIQLKLHTYVQTYIHTWHHFINPHKPLGFGYETCPQNFTNIIDIHKTDIYIYI